MTRGWGNGNDRPGDAQAPETVVDVRERTSRSTWWLLALSLVVALVVLLREPVADWLVSRAAALKESVRGPEPASRERPAPASGQTATSPRAQSATAGRAPETPPPVANATLSNSNAAAKPAERAPLPAIKPLYPVPSPPPPPPPPPQPSAPVPEGRAGLVEALRAGVLRPATAADIARWKSRHASTAGAAPGSGFDEHLQMFEAYVIKDDFVIPAGLNGAHAAVFVLEAGVPYPRGEAGHSVVLDLASGACVGRLCRMLLR